MALSGARRSAAKGRFAWRVTPAFCSSRHFWKAASSCAGVRGVLDGGRECELELAVVVKEGTCFRAISRCIGTFDQCETPTR